MKTNNHSKTNEKYRGKEASVFHETKKQHSNKEEPSKPARSHGMGTGAGNKNARYLPRPGVGPKLSKKL
jgi:hypothetical protein